MFINNIRLAVVTPEGVRMQGQRLVVGKGKTTRPGDAEEWTREYFEIEAVIEDPAELEVTKANLTGLIDGWLSASKPVARGPSPQGAETAQAPALKEETFNILKFEPQEGAKIGPYDVAYKGNNVEDKWTSAHNILRQSNATINSRYHGEGYAYSYWLYGEGKIYRQKLKKT